MPFKKGSSGNPAGRRKTSALVKAATIRAQNLAAKEIPKSIARLVELRDQDGDVKVAVAAAKELIAIGTDKGLLVDNDERREALQVRKLEAEIKILEQRGPGDSADPMAIAAEQQKRLDDLRQRYPELQAMPGNDERQDA